MPWMPGIPHDADAPTHGTDSSPPIGCVLHRTIGHWGGDYTVIKGGGLAHFLIGQLDGQWVQFADTDNYEWHAGGANDWSVGVEFSGQNGEALTEWQIDAGGQVLRWIAGQYSIPYDYNDGSGGRNGPVHEFVAHNYVSEPEDQHTDYVNRDDFIRMTEGDIVTDEQMATLGRWMQEQSKVIITAINGQNRAWWGKGLNLGDIVNTVNAASDKVIKSLKP